MEDIFKEYPTAVRMEVQMLEQLIGAPVSRKVIEPGKGRRRVVYDVATLGAMPNRGATGLGQRGTLGSSSSKVPTFLEM